jgi:transcriptional regulator with XRE-family HTH domain
MDLTPETTDALRRQLRQARLDAGLSRAELARRLGVSEATVIRIENGTRSTPIWRAQKWMTECGFSVEAISMGEPEHASLLASAVASLDQKHLQEIAKVVGAWPKLDASVRQAILTLVAPHVP